jgi:predicted RNase H-like HicB family nuclease
MEEPVSETKEFRIDVHYEPDHMWAEVVDLPGCFASGRDADELREALAEAIGMYESELPGECKVVSLEFDPSPKAVSSRAAKLMSVIRRILPNTRVRAAAVTHARVRAELVPA